MVVVVAISPPEFEHYADLGLYNRRLGIIDTEAAFFAQTTPCREFLLDRLSSHTARPQPRSGRGT